MAEESQQVRVGDRKIRISHLSKVLYPATGTTKRDVIAYLSEISEVMLPHCRDRAATRKRWPNGAGETGDGSSFFQKDIGDGAPDWVITRPIQHSDHTNLYPLVNDEATLVWLAQLAALEIHVPQWRFDASGAPRNPDRMVLDLDPGPGVTLRECASFAFLVRDLLDDIGLPSIPVTSGSKGIHLYARLDGSASSDAISEVARELARSLEADHPDLITSSMKKIKRDGKVLIDWSQNRFAKTTVAPYSLRGRQRPTVAAPRTWRELASPHLKQLEYDEVLRRVRRRGDPMAALAESDDDRVHRRLERYRSKRDAQKTPEPVPEHPDRSSSKDPDEPSDVPRFVIQRHEARALHFDFRLEHHGVLVSWALPKGVPTDPKKNHLAVPTEDHPLEYRHFEGTIPRGEYGAGEVTIWDAGTYVLEKWREDEVIVVLTGRPGGGLQTPQRYVLFRTSADVESPTWMIHLMDPPDAGAYEPMLASRATAAELARLPGSEWTFEMKWDGMRAIALVDSAVVLRSRSGRDLTAQFPELRAFGAQLPVESAVLDGEIVAMSPRGIPDFQVLQERWGLSRTSEITAASRSAPVSYVVFDLLALNGIDCRKLPYRERREMLEQLFSDEDSADDLPQVTIPPSMTGDVDNAMATSRELGLEGVMAKRNDSPYRSGIRTSDWLKLPFITTEEVLIIGWRMSPTHRSTLASLLVATVRNGSVRYAGRVGTGFTESARKTALRMLKPLEVPSTEIEVPASIARDAHWVTPELWGEVTYAQMTTEGRLRHPVWRGWRPDKG